MTRFLFYLLSFLYYLRGYFYCFLFSHTHSSLFFIAFLLGCGYFFVFHSSIPMAVYFFAYWWVFFLAFTLYTHGSLFFIAFLLFFWYSSCLLLSIPTAVYFLLHFCLAVGIFPVFCSHIPTAVYFFLLFCLAVGIFLDLCFPYPHFLFYLIFDGSCASIIAANISTHPALSLIDRLSCKITHPASTEKQDSRLSINDAIVGLTFLCPII